MSTVRILKSLIPAFYCLAFAAACTRPGSGGTSRIVIQSPQNFGKVGTLSLPAGRTACWGANITGEGVRGANASACSPATGVTAGYKPSGEEISAQVAKGQNRKIDLYVYLLPAGSTAACPGMAAVIPPAQLMDTYLVGSATADFVEDTTVVEITATFPGLSQNLAATHSMPATCTANAGVPGTPPPFHPSPAQAVVSDGTYTLRARVGIASLPGDLTNSSYRLKLK